MPTRTVSTLHEGDITGNVVKYYMESDPGFEWTDYEVHLSAKNGFPLITIREDELNRVQNLLQRAEQVISDEWSKVDQAEALSTPT